MSYSDTEKVTNRYHTTAQFVQEYTQVISFHVTTQIQMIENDLNLTIRIKRRKLYRYIYIFSYEFSNDFGTF